MLKIIAGFMGLMLISVLVSQSLASNDLGVTVTDVKIAKFVCEDKGGLMEMEVGEFKCYNGFIGNEASLLDYNINTVRKAID